MWSPKPSLPRMLSECLNLGEQSTKIIFDTLLSQVGDCSTLPSLLLGDTRWSQLYMRKWNWSDPKKWKWSNDHLMVPPLGLIALPLNCMLNTAGNCSYDYRSVDLGFRNTFDIDFFCSHPGNLALPMQLCNYEKNQVSIHSSLLSSSLRFWILSP